MDHSMRIIYMCRGLRGDKVADLVILLSCFLLAMAGRVREDSLYLVDDVK